MKKSALEIFLRGSAVSLAGTVLFGVMNYFVRRTLSLTLPVEDYGAFYSTFSLFSMIFAFGELGLNQSAVTLIAKYAGMPEQHSFFSALFFLRFGISFLTALIVIAGAGFLSRHYLNGTSVLVFVIMGLVFFMQTLEGCFRSLYEGLKAFGTQQGFLLLSGAFLLIGVFAAGKALIAVCLVFLAAVLLSFSCNTLFCCIRKKVRIVLHPEKKVWRELFSLCSRLALSTALFTSLYHMDTVMLTFLKGEKSSALYNIALPVMQIVQAAMVFPCVMLPVAVDMSKQNDWKGLRRFARIAFLLSLLAAPLCYCFFAWSGRWIVTLLFSGKYAEASAAVPLLCTALVFYTLGHFLLQLLISLGAYNSVVLTACICFACNIVFNYLLILRFDFVGAGSATLISYILFAVTAFLLLKKQLNLKKVSAI